MRSASSPSRSTSFDTVFDVCPSCLLALPTLFSSDWRSRSGTVSPSTLRCRLRPRRTNPPATPAAAAPTATAGPPARFAADLSVPTTPLPFELAALGRVDRRLPVPEGRAPFPRFALDALAAFVRFDRLAAFVRCDALAAFVRFDALAPLVRFDALAAFVRFDPLAAFVRFDAPAAFVRFGALAALVRFDAVAPLVRFDPALLLPLCDVVLVAIARPSRSRSSGTRVPPLYTQ
jgi:uncharacterized membrane protein